MYGNAELHCGTNLLINHYDIRISNPITIPIPEKRRLIDDVGSRPPGQLPTD